MDRETLLKELVQIRKVITERVDELAMGHNWDNDEIKSTITDLLHQYADIFRDIAKLDEKELNL